MNLFVDLDRWVCALVENTVDETLSACVSLHAVQNAATFGEPLHEQRAAALPTYAPDSDKCACIILFKDKLIGSCRLRVVSYNVLADLYLNLKLPQEQLFFPYCQREFQSLDYRYGLLLAELPRASHTTLTSFFMHCRFAGYDADILCLQEVDYRFYCRYLRQYMPAQGYNVVLRVKVGSICALTALLSSCAHRASQ